MKLKQIIKSTDWHKRWVVPDYSLLSCSLMADGYRSYSLKRFKTSLPHNIFIVHDGSIVCYQSEKENEKFGQLVAKQLKKDGVGYIKELKKATKDFYNFLYKKPDLSKEVNYKRLKEIYSEYLPLFIAMTRGANYLNGQKFNKILKDLEKMRLATETIYLDANKYLMNFARKKLGKQKYSLDLLNNLSYQELGIYISSDKIPSHAELKNRYALVSMNETNQWLSKNEVVVFEKAVNNKYKSNPKKVIGQNAFEGKVRGVVRVITNPKKYKQFNIGDILITGMTRPEYLMLMKKSGAIVTDAGGVLSHAAITARELKKPCIIGTQVATKVFKDGDMVEVDANKGIVRKI